MIKTPIENKEVLSQLEKLEDDEKDIFLLANGSVRITAVSATHIVNQMRANHRLGLLETYVLGQAYIAGLLLTSTIKGNDRIQLNIECGGPIKGISVEAWAVGAVRGYLLENPIPLKEPLKSLDTSPLFGPGFITVTKILEGSKEPVSGTVMMQHGNIAEDLALYFQESEQTPTLFYISICFDRNGNVTGAGGLFIQALPGCSDETLEKLQEKAKRLPSLGQAIDKGMKLRKYIEEEFADFDVQFLDDRFVAFSCPCTREHFINYLARLPENEKKAILAGHFPLTLECFNCASLYTFEKEEVERLFEEKNQ